ncbi:MAG: bestrophin [Myxococcales bacterium]|nr:bestrophin [Myxococcales bacterium]
MIVTKRDNWWQFVLSYRGTELPRTKWRILGVAIVASVVTFLEEKHGFHPNLTPLPYTLIGVALGIFLGFRNNASYDRWWEGRKLWGALVNTSRTLARQFTTLVGPKGAPTDEVVALRKTLVYRGIAFVHALRLSLRSATDYSELEPFLSREEVSALANESNKPAAITHGTAKLLRDAWERGWIDTMHLPSIDATLTALTDIQGGCERIKSTPIPFLSTTLMHRIVAAYCYTLPFGVVDAVKIYTPFVVVLVAYAFFGLDVVGDELEEPFGTEPNDLSLSAISRMIEVNLRQRLGETELPPMLQPVDEVLS